MVIINNPDKINVKKMLLNFPTKILVFLHEKYILNLSDTNFVRMPKVPN